MKQLTGNDLQMRGVAELQIIRSRRAKRVTWHSHDGCQLLFVLRGATAYEFRQPGVGKLEMPGGHFLVIPPGVAHRGIHDIRPPCTLFSVILGANPARTAANVSLTEDEWNLIEGRLQNSGLIVRPVSTELRRMVATLAREVLRWKRQSTEPLRHARVRTLVCEVLIEVNSRVSRTSSEAGDDVVVASQRYLREHLGEAISVSSLAETVGVSRARLFAAFKRDAGISPHDFLLRARVEKAGVLLATTRRQVTEIAMETGFGSSQYFSTVFRKFTGQTPLEYRAELQSGGAI